MKAACIPETYPISPQPIIDSITSLDREEQLWEGLPQECEFLVKTSLQIRDCVGETLS